MTEREDWRCGTCAYWEKWGDDSRDQRGRCLNKQAEDMAGADDDMNDEFWLRTSPDFGCRFWSAKPLEDKGADIPIASHNEG